MVTTAVDKKEKILQETLEICEGSDYDTICKLMESLPCLTRMNKRIWGDSFYLTSSRVDTWLHTDGRLFELMSNPINERVLAVIQAIARPDIGQQEKEDNA